MFVLLFRWKKYFSTKITICSGRYLPLYIFLSYVLPTKLIEKVATRNIIIIQSKNLPTYIFDNNVLDVTHFYFDTHSSCGGDLLVSCF